MAVMAAAVTRHEWDHLADAFHEDALLEYPQSGEVFRGIANIRAQYENYPDLEPGTSNLAEVIGDDAYAMTPSYTVIRVEGSGNRGTAVIRVRYPDGSWWWVINLFEVRDGRMTRCRAYFAPDFPAPDWRVPYRESP
jgi:ketosteroid isomerase-like protein